MALREAGRTGFLRALDVSRAAGVILGDRLHADGRLRDPSLIHQLTMTELLNPTDGLNELTGRRREVWEGFRALTLPEFWVGSPTTENDATTEADDGTVSGLGVSPGIVEGHARVIVDPSKGELDPGEILVCRTTDPSWAVFFQLASALVIDVGGPMSHGAIVARELGLPAVVNTRTGTRRITTGMRLRVNGTTGLVEILGGA
jgi:pyruvate,water dikinase